MTATLPFGATATDSFDQTPSRHHPDRWRLSRAGIINVWHYYDNTFDLSGGRLILRGTNGAGKSRALEMLLPFLLDADRRTMGTGTPVRMEELMSAGAEDQSNRLGYLWLELRRDPDPDPDAAGVDGARPEYLTLGALVRYARSTREAKVWYFTTGLRVGDGLRLLGPDRMPLARRDLTELIGADSITAAPDRHRERVRQQVFGLTGELGRDRYAGLCKLLHTLRSPDVGNRIEEGRLPVILSSALPPLSEDALTDAGQQLDGLTETRNAQQRLEATVGQVGAFLDVYRRYLTGVLTGSAGAVRDRAADLRAAEQRAGELRARAEQLATARTEAEARLDQFDATAAELEAVLDGLRRSDAYRHAGQLSERADKVASLARSADTALSAAGALREAEARVTDAADDRAGDVQDAAAALGAALGRARTELAGIGLTEHTLPAVFAAHREAAPAPVDVVPVSRDGGPERITRPVPDSLSAPLADPDELRDTAAQLGRAADTRRVQAGNRAGEARELVAERGRVQQAADRATDAERDAQADAEAAEAAQGARDDRALALVDAWRAWLEAPESTDLFGSPDWHRDPVLAVLLTDRTALCGDDGDAGPDLSELDRAPDGPAAAVRHGIATELAGLGTQDDAGRVRVAELTAERDDLLAARDPDPPLEPWRRPGGVPLWRCVDFVDGLAGADRAGVEAGLLAAGLLTATVEPDGRVTAQDGQVLLTAQAGPVTRPLSAVLRPDPAAPLPAGAVRAVLSRVGFDDPTAVTWVGPDGRWGNGPLRGRHTATEARHIGPSARAAARARRLAELDADLADLAAAAAARAARRAALTDRQRRLDDHLRTGPRSTALTAARIEADHAARAARRAQAKAADARRLADELARAWTERDRAHREACEEFGLPTEAGALERVAEAARAASATCDAVSVHVRGLVDRLGRHAVAVRDHATSAGRRAEAEGAAAAALREWGTESTTLETMARALGAEAEQVRQEIGGHEKSLREVRTERARAGGRRDELIGQSGTVSANAASAEQAAGQRRDELGAAVTGLLDQLDQPGVADTALIRPVPRLFTDPGAEPVAADVAVLLGALRRSRCDENALIRAQQTFERSIADSYDVVATVAAGIRLFALVDATGNRPLAAAAAEITRRCEQGRAALTDREQRVFTEFILGEVGEELRRRIVQAQELVTAMNASLRSIRTSHGIGVRLTWRLAEGTSGNIPRIKELVATAASVRTPAQDGELTGLLAAKVAAEAVEDPTGSYAVHLRNALDYRAWHEMEVIITGPEPGRERRLNRRAKLSQGETRFVSYVTLFAAAEAYLSGLDDSALRLILLDDAFAKVDEPTIAELLGLLVRLDIDFAMTGHALWGCVPQVPALDVYEICREEGTPAVTVHVRWDGRNRQFLHST